MVVVGGSLYYTTLRLTSFFLLILVVCVKSITPLSILLGNTKTESNAVTCHIKDNDSTAVQKAETIIKNFITNGGHNDMNGDEFYIHGWKWHTMSLIHEARRLSRIAATLHDQKEQNLQQVEEISEVADVLALQTVVDYTIGFNMRGLHRIENEVFFPYVRQRISSSLVNKKAVAAAIAIVLDQLDKDRKRVESMGTSLVRLSDFFIS
jgi:hypothetical protein